MTYKNKTSWIQEVKNNSFDSVAGNLGIRKNGFRYGPCPACGASQVGRKDRRLPIGRTSGTNVSGWRCFAEGCGAGGDMLDLVAYKIEGVRLRDVQDYTQIKDFFNVKNFETQEVIEPQKENLPAEDLENLFASMSSRKVHECNHRHVDAYLKGRGLNPRAVNEACVFSPTFNYLSLKKVTTSSGNQMPFWPYSWSRDYPLCVPLFDAKGNLRNFQGRAITKLESGRKTMCPIGFNMAGLVFADQNARRWMREEDTFDRVWIVEGEIDFLHLASIVPETDAVIGIKNGSISFFNQCRLPAMSEVIIATDNDAKGDEYAKTLANHIYPLKPNRLELGTCSDVNEFLSDGNEFSDMIDNIVPFEDYDEIVAQIGLTLMSSAFTKAEEATRVQRVEFVSDLADHIEPLSQAFRLYNNQANKYWYRLQAIHGCGKICTKLKERINLRLMGHQEQARVEKSIISQELEGPDPKVELVRKVVKEKGVVIGYGEIKNIEQNLISILGHDRRLKGRFRYNEHSDTTEVDGKPITDNKVMEISIWLQQHYEGFRMDQNIIGRGLEYVASKPKNSFHPVADMLRELYKMDLSDAPDHARPERLWDYYFGADLGPEVNGSRLYGELIQQYGIIFCITLVKRALQPGCKADTLPVLIGPQGCGKSTGLRALALKDDFFSDTPFDVKNKDAFQMLRGVWLYEIGEAESLLRGGFRAVKGFITAQVDRYRKPYRSHISTSPRGGAFATTSNEPQIEFLSDPSGSRRYHAMMVGMTHNVRVQQLKEDAKYIWARAMHMYHGTGEYVDAGPMQENWIQDQELQDLSRRLNEKFSAGDPWVDFIGAYCLGIWNQWAYAAKTRGKDSSLLFISPKIILSDILQIPAGHQTPKEMKRCTEVLSQIGCKPKGQKRIGQKRVSVWSVPENYNDLESFNLEQFRKNNVDL